MAFVIADRVRETTTTTGTGAVTLAGAYISFQTFSAAIGNGNQTYYTIASAATGEWEVGIGTYTAVGNTLTRNTILASSNAGAAVNFTSGSKDVFVTQPSERALLLNTTSNGLVAGNAAFTSGDIPYANSTTTLTNLAIGAANRVLTSTGSAPQWVTSLTGLTGVSSSGITNTSLTSGRVVYSTTGGAETDSANLTFDGTTLTAANITSGGTWTFSGGTANGVVYLNGSKQATSGSALTFDGSALDLAGAALQRLGFYNSSAATDEKIYAWQSGSAVGNGIFRLRLINDANSDGVNAYVIDRTGTSIDYQAWSAATTEGMRLTSTGLGIGTSSPGAKLDVNTSAIAISATVTNGQFYLREFGGSSANNTLELNIRPNSGKSGYLTFTENAVADRWSLGIANGNSSLRFISGTPTTGTERMVLDSSGNLGIGTSSPAAKLDVNGAGIVRGFLTTTDAIKLGGNTSAPSSTDAFIYRPADNTLAFGTASAERARITSAGNFGIGTTSPATNLQIGGTAPGSGASGGLGVFLSRGVTTNFYEAYDGTKSFIAGVDNTQAFAKVGTLSSHPVAIIQANGSAIYIDTSKNVGIGTTSPSFKFHVKGAGSYDGNIFADNSSATGGGIFGIGVNGTRIGFLSTSGSAVGDTSQDIAIYNETNNGIRLYTNSAERARITSGGYFGVGTSSPSTTYTMTIEGIGADSPNQLYLKRQGNTQGLRISAGGGVATYDSYEGTDVVYGAHVWNATKGSNTVERARITNDGDFLVGTATSLGRITTTGTGNQTIYFTHSDNSPGRTVTLRLGNNNSTYYTASPYIQAIQGGGIDTYSLAFGTASGVTTASERMRIDSLGNVGIGTASVFDSNTKLELSKSGNCQQFISSTDGARMYFSANGSTAGSVAMFSNHPLIFKTNDTERARITSDGKLLVGTSSLESTGGADSGATAAGFGYFKSSRNTLYATCTDGTNSYEPLGLIRTASTGNLAAFWYGLSTQVGTITTNGTNTAYNTSSDRRLKENIVPADSAGAVIDAIEVVKHDWKAGGHTRYGMIAQDLHAIVPEAVSVGDPDSVEELKQPWGVDYSKLVPMLVKEIQSLRQRVAQLEVK